MPPAPPTFSKSTGWPKSSESRDAKIRPKTSPAPGRPALRSGLGNRCDDCWLPRRSHHLPAPAAVALKLALDDVVLEVLWPSKANHIIDRLWTGTPFVDELAGATGPRSRSRAGMRPMKGSPDRPSSAGVAKYEIAPPRRCPLRPGDLTDEMIARKIIELAKAGERDVELLSTAALNLPA